MRPTEQKIKLNKNAIVKILKKIGKGKSWLATQLGYSCDATITRRLSDGWKPGEISKLCKILKCNRTEIEAITTIKKPKNKPLTKADILRKLTAKIVKGDWKNEEIRKLSLLLGYKESELDKKCLAEKDESLDDL